MPLATMEWIFLSHVIDGSTPVYGGGGHVVIDRVRSMAAGDSSNNSELDLPAHAGTHIDAPLHFDSEGRSVEGFPASFWHCARPWLIDCPAEPEEILGMEKLREALEEIPAEADLLLLRTGFESHRVTDPHVYATRGPGIAPEIADWLRRNRRLKMLGFDFISVSSYAHRDIGRQAHRAFLGSTGGPAGTPPVLLLEDMMLADLPGVPTAVWVVPLRFSLADGAPATVLASISRTGSPEL